MRVPKTTAPLVKLIRTGEGIILFAFNIAAIVLAVLDQVSPEVAVKYAAIFNSIAFASRQFLKIVAALRPVVGSPVDPFGGRVSWPTPPPVTNGSPQTTGEEDVSPAAVAQITDAEEFADQPDARESAR